MMVGLAAAVLAATQPIPVTLLFTNDTYGFHGREGMPGGVARRKAAIDRVRAEQEHVVLVDAGNSLGQFYYARADRGELAASLLQELGYDGVNVGVHELDYGRDRLEQLAGRFRLDLVSTNLRAAGAAEAPFFATPHRIVRRQGARIALLGLCDPLVAHKTNLGRFEGLEVRDPEQALRDHLASLADRSIGAVVVLANLGFGQAADLARRVPGIDVIIARSESEGDEYAHDGEGGARVPLEVASVGALGPPGEEPPPRTLVVAAGRYGHFLGRVDLQIVPGRKGRVVSAQPSVIPLGADAPVDPELAARIDEHVARVRERRSGILLRNARRALGGALTEDRMFEVVLTAMRETTGAEVAAINVGAFSKLDYTLEQIRRDDVIRVVDVDRMMWTDNHLVEVSLTGADLAQAYQQGEGRLRWVGLEHRAGALWVNGRALAEGETYTVATSSFLVSTNSWIPALAQGTFAEGRYHPRTRPTHRQTLRQLAADALTDPLPPPSPYPPQWRLHVEGLSLGISTLMVDRTGDPAVVPDARAQAVDMLRLSGSGRLSAILDSDPVVWSTAAEVRYAQLELGGVTSEPEDLLRFSTQLDARALSLYGVLPSLLAAYDTEFTPRDGMRHRHFLRLAAGLSTDWGGLLQELGVYAVSEVNLTEPQVNTGVGVMAVARFRRELGELLTLGADGELRYVPWYAQTRPDSLLLMAVGRAELGVKLIGQLAIAPRVELFYFETLLPGTFGSNVQLGVALSYGRLFKL